MTNYYKKTGQITDDDNENTRCITKNYYPVYNHEGKFVGNIIFGRFEPK